MGKDESAILESIDPSELTAIARQALRRDAFHIGTWRMSQLGGGFGNPVSE